MKINAKGRKFYFYDDKPEEGWIQIKVPTDTNEVRIADEDFWNDVILDWDNIEDDDGFKLPCDAETKRYVMRESPAIRIFVMKCFTELANELNEFRKSLEKN